MNAQPQFSAHARQFEESCARISAALERVTDHSSQIADAFRAMTAMVKDAHVAARPKEV